MYRLSIRSGAPGWANFHWLNQLETEVWLWCNAYYVRKRRQHGNSSMIFNRIIGDSPDYISQLFCRNSDIHIVGLHAMVILF